MRRSLCFPSFHELRRARGALVRRATFAASAATLLATLSHAQRFGFPEELVPPALPGQARPFAAVDFDGVNGVDLMTSGAPGVLLNDGNGSFTATSAPSSIPAVSTFPMVNGLPSPFPNFVAIDVDNSGGVDLVGYGNGATPLVSLNDGNGGFLPGLAPTVPFPLLPPGSTVTAIVAGDFDNDGNPDLVLSVQPLQPLLLYRGLPGGGFVDDSAVAFPATVPQWNSGALQLATADCNLDGLLDLVTAEPLVGGSQRQLLLNVGAGVFGAPSLIGSLLPANPLAETFALGDLDGNTLPDAIFFANFAAAGATAPAEFVLDVAFPGNATPALGAAIPTTPTVFQVGSVPTLAPNTPNPVPGMLGTSRAFYVSHPSVGTGSFAMNTVGGVSAISPTLLSFGGRGVVGDFDVDGDEDYADIHVNAGGPAFTRLVFATPNGPVSIGGTSEPAPFIGAGQPGMYAFGDGDADLDLDIFSMAGLVAANDGDGRFAWTSAPTNVTTPNVPLLVGDLTGTGFADTITSVAGVPTVNVSPMVTPGTSFALTMPPTTNGAISRAVKSPTGIDFAVVTGSNVVFFTNVGSPGVVLPPPTTPLPVPPVILALAVDDLDADGDDDVAFGTILGTGTIYVALNVGTTAAPVFAAPTAISTSVPIGVQTGAIGLAVGDLNADGRPDIVSGANVYLQLATGTFSYASTLAVLPQNWLFSPALADLDGDGDLDVLGNTGGAGACFLNNGTGAFGALIGLPAPLANPPAVADVDFDGDPDYVSSTGDVVLNLLRQLALGLPARPGRPFSLQFFHEFGGGTLFNDYWVPSLAPATAPLVGTFLVDPGTAISPVPLAPNVPGAIAPLGAPVAINGDVDVQLVPNVPALVGFTFFTQAGVSRPTFPGLIYLTGRRTVTIRNL
ncbi:MAG: VCBS repeat-containing protein [Planctomycetes bacterium]|nr:VCBS repeat-containing protein [Planctomycetota bacterium]